MAEDLERAIKILDETGCTCVACKGESTYRSIDRGVTPLIVWLDSNTDMMGYSVADKVVGKGAALLYCLLGVRRVYGRVMSVAAMKVLRSNGIEATWGALAESIMNRKKTGNCPIEAATASVDDPAEALEVIRETLKALN